MNNNKAMKAIFGLCVLSILIGIVQLFGFPHKAPSKSIKTHRSKILVINIDGMIKSDLSKEQFSLRESSSQRALKQLQKAYYNKRIKGVLIRVDSPGGTVGASQELYRAIERLKTQNKYVVVSFADIGASGAYYMASAANHIIANPGTLVGSIGVIMDGFNAQELLKKLGIKKQVVKSGKYKDTFSYWKAFSKIEKSMLQSLTDEIHQQFIDDILKHRKTKIKNIEDIAQGQIFTGSRALEVGLIDSIGGKLEALDILSKKLDIRIAPTLLEEEHNFLEKIMSEINIQTQVSSPFELQWLNKLGQPSVE